MKHILLLTLLALPAFAQSPSERFNALPEAEKQALRDNRSAADEGTS